ncbi:beta strand repeat-containing protein [Reyranella sp.]|uniref:beta strand repeat-containing protein n=1 Tax=Reyranella sp. TaxID=1929291 RepID=UPI003D098D09
MATIEFASSSVDVPKEALKNAFYNLTDSQGFYIVLERISTLQRQRGSTFSVEIVDDIPGTDAHGVVTRYYRSTGNAEILIEKNAFDGDFYYYGNGAGTHAMSLERYLAEEVFHVYQGLTSSHLSDTEAEIEAQDFANKVMAEIHGVTNEPVADIPADPMINPNTHPGSGLSPVVKNVSPYDPAVLDWLEPHAGGDDNDGETTETYADETEAKVGEAENNGSPLVLDLDDDGVELLNLNSGDAIYWDIDNDGFAEASGWVSSDDGLLAIDLNQDGVVNNSSEVFGDQTGYANGFLALAAYDSNEDGKISEQDAVWDNLRVWTDDNGDGNSQGAELHTLDGLLITEIGLAYTNVNTTIAGNSIKQKSTFVIDGNVHDIVDAYFNYSDLNTVYSGDQSVGLNAAFLPTLRGYGRLASLHIAMSDDNNNQNPQSLISLISNLDARVFSDVFSDDASIFSTSKAIMLRWAKVDSVSSTSRGNYIDAQELEFLEKFTGRDFLQRGWMTDPGSLAAEQLKEAFHIAQSNIAARLMAQGAGGDLFTGSFRYDLSTDKFLGVTGIDAGALADLVTLAGSASDLEAFWQNVVRMIEFTVGVSSLSAEDQADLEDAINGSNPTLHLNDVVDSLDYDAPTGMNLSGTASGDTLTGDSGNDRIVSGYGNDVLNGGIGDDYLAGQGDSDILNGGTGGDYLLGGFGVDVYEYNLGDGGDTIVEDGTGTGNTSDRILFGVGIDLGDLTFTRAANNRDLVIDIDTGSQTGSIIIEDQFNYSAGGGSVELLDFNGASTYALTTRAWTMHGTVGADDLRGVTSGGLDTDTIYGEGGDDEIGGGNGADTLLGGDGNDDITGDAGNDILYGDEGDDTLDGGASDDAMYGGSGNDHMRGGPGNDTYYFVGGKDSIDDSSGADTIRLDAAWNGIAPQYLRIGSSLRVYFDAENCIDIDNYYSASRAVETLAYADATTVNLTTVSYVAQGTSGNDTLTGNAFANAMYGEAGDDSMYGGDGTDTMYGGDGNDSMQGQNQNDFVYGGAGSDTLYGNAGDDYLEGGAGDDYMQGGTNNDTFKYASGIDRIYDQSGTDVLQIVAGYDLSDAAIVRRIDGPTGAYDLRVEFSSTNYVWIEEYFTGTTYNVESLVFADATAVTLNALAYTLYGSAAADTAYGVSAGGISNDTMYGLGGNDNLDGGTGDDYLYGGEGDDKLLGGAGNDTINGGAGSDTLNGGTNIDTLTYSDAAAAITVSLGVTIAQNTGGAGTDTVSAFENLTGSAFNDALTGDGNANVIQGGSSDDTIEGGAGNDTLDGGAGTGDTLKCASATSAITVSLAVATAQVTGGAGTDTVSNFENVTGSAYNDVLTGNVSNNVMDGGTGADTMTGGAGNDTYYVDNASDTVIETSGAGTDLVYSSGSFNLSGQYIENLTLTGSGNTDATGNSLDNVLTGNSGNNVLNGGTGADTMTGGAGDDTYYVNSAADTVIETSGAGTDLVHSSVSFNLSGQYIENLTLTGSGNTNATGNSLANTLTGNSGNNVLNGGTGADTMAGGAGDDTYYVNATSDSVIEVANSGTDQIFSSVSYSLSGQHIENLTLTGSGNTNVAGNSLANILVGNSGNNVLNGSTGADTMTGGAGNDTYVVDNAGDTVVEASGSAGGTDLVQSSVSFSLSGHYIENLTLTASGNTNATGNSLANTLTGSSGNNALNGGTGNDVLNGGAGADVLTGGSGQDTFVFDSALTGNIDTVADFSAANDTIRLDQSIFTAITTLGTLSAAAFFAGPAAHDADDRIVYNAVTGNLFYDSDGTGANAAVQFAQLNGTPTISNADFHVMA